VLLLYFLAIEPTLNMGRFVKIVFGILSIIVALIAIGIGYLKLDNVYRKKRELAYLIKCVLTKLLKHLISSVC